MTGEADVDGFKNLHSRLRVAELLTTDICPLYDLRLVSAEPLN